MYVKLEYVKQYSFETLYGHFRHARLLSLLNKFRDSIAPDTKSPVLVDSGTIVNLSPDLNIDKVLILGLKWNIEFTQSNTNPYLSERQLCLM